MDKTPLKITLNELEAVGVQSKVTINGRHPRVHWFSPNGQHRAVTCSISPSDRNAYLVAQRLVRRLLRQDGILK
jgi:hypothetical protein